ncbi:MAG: CXXX repeat peptide modification system protein, partial [Bacteroidales bacterium]|nr:CXXX repeat peptide modification system protein [Bacteroidales bacterium]
MNKEKVGAVTETEKEEIKKIFMRKVALNELLPSLGNDLLSKTQKDELYEKIIADLAETSSNSEAWWQRKASEYKWKKAEN